MTASQELPNPGMLAPKIMVFAVALGSVTSLCFVIVLLFTLKDIETVISSASGPLLQIYYQATSSRTGATCLLIFNIGAMAFATQGLVMIASRVVFSMARDRLFGPTSRPLGRISNLWKVPTWALMFTAVWIIIFGLIFLGSSVALNAILSASVVFLQLSYLTPILLMTFRGSKVLEPAGFPARRLKLGIAGPPIRILASIFALVTTVFFVFPPDIPVTSGTTMNWVIVVVAIVIAMMVINWFIDARKNYRGPENTEYLLARAAQASMVAQYSKGK